MQDKITIHHPTAQTHIPAHEQAARHQRATVTGLPTQPAAPQPAPDLTDYRNWYYAMQAANL